MLQDIIIGLDNEKYAMRPTSSLLSLDSSAIDSFHRCSVVARSKYLIFMAKSHPSFFKDALHSTCTRNDHHLPTFAHPDRRLVGSLESMYRSISVIVWCRGNTVLPSLCYPTSHRKRRSCRRNHSPRIIWGIAAIPYETDEMRLDISKHGRIISKPSLRIDVINSTACRDCELLRNSLPSPGHSPRRQYQDACYYLEVHPVHHEEDTRVDTSGGLPLK